MIPLAWLQGINVNTFGCHIPSFLTNKYHYYYNMLGPKFFYTYMRARVHARMCAFVCYAISVCKQDSVLTEKIIQLNTKNNLNLNNFIISIWALDNIMQATTAL